MILHYKPKPRLVGFHGKWKLIYYRVHTFLGCYKTFEYYDSWLAAIKDLERMYKNNIIKVEWEKTTSNSS